ncbi:MAG: PEGA domain-containing protein [Deltaproteobacteria bacterium]|nr:PEGA domain-containing protein [Deltaproteobacteria bacterium]
MTRRRAFDPRWKLPILLVVLAFSLPARADEDGDKARAAFLEGTALVAKAQWGEALAAFERARDLRKHPITTYNIAACERAMGRYTRARALYRAALDESASAADATKRLPESLVAETTAVLAEIDRLLVRVTLDVEPRGSSLTVDGRPPAADGKDAFVAGLGAPGAALVTPGDAFVLLLDPGRHVLVFARRGFRDVVVSRTFEPGQATTIHLELTQVPASIHVSASQPGALVVVDGADVGPVPIDILRPPGVHRVVVRRDGFVPYDTRIDVGAGEETTLRAELTVDKPAIYSRWWFWALAGVVVAGVTTGTYLLTRPAPTAPEVDGGTIGWRVDIR